MLITVLRCATGGRVTITSLLWSVDHRAAPLTISEANISVYHYVDFPDCLLLLLSISVFLLFSFFSVFTLFSCRFRAVD